jgi:membrane protein required for colicin V production
VNWLDVLIGAVLVLSFAGALWNGLSREVVRLFALVGGILGGMWWYNRLAPHLKPLVDDEHFAAFAAFLLIVLGSLLAGAVVAWFLGKILRWTGLRWFDRLLGGAFGLVRGLLLAAALVLAVIAFQPTAGSAEGVAGSRLAPWVLYGAYAAATAAPAELRTKFQRGFERVREVWIETSPKTLVKR